MTKFDRIAVVSIYAAMMLGFAWLVGLAMPSLVDRLRDMIGSGGMNFLLFATPTACWGLAYWLSQRTRSGRSLDP